jgi:hypothetical protein
MSSLLIIYYFNFSITSVKNDIIFAFCNTYSYLYSNLNLCFWGVYDLATGIDDDINAENKPNSDINIGSIGYFYFY